MSKLTSFISLYFLTSSVFATQTTYENAQDALDDFEQNQLQRTHDSEIKQRVMEQFELAAELDGRAKLKERERRKKFTEEKAKLERLEQGRLDATRIFNHVKDALLTNEALQQAVLQAISQQGTSVELVKSHWNLGIYSEFSGFEPLNTRYLKETIQAFGARSFTLFGTPQYRYDFSSGPFNGWRLEAYKVIRTGIIFLLPYPETQLRISLYKPSWYSW